MNIEKLFSLDKKKKIEEVSRMYHVQNLNYPIETIFQSRKEKLISLFLEEQRLNFT